MNRRRFLAVATACSAGMAGCQFGGRDRPTNSTDPPGSQSPTETPTPEPRIETSIETTRYRVFAYEQTIEDRAIEPRDITPESEIAAPLRSALTDALDGSYETDDISEELLAAIDEFRHHGIGYRFEPYVRLDGTPYAFDPTVPVFTARMESDGDETDPDPSVTVNHDDLKRFDEQVRDFVETIGAFTVHSPRDEYRISVVPTPVEDFLDQYEYVRDPGGVGRIVTERVDPGPPYSIDLRKLTTEDLWGRSVVDGDALPDDLRSFLKNAIASDRRAPAHPPSRSEFRADELPASYAEWLQADDEQARDPYVDLDGTNYAFRVTEIYRGQIPATVDVSARPAADSATFTLTVEPSEAEPKPDVQGTLEFEARGALPSVLWIESEDDRHLLSSDAYESVSWVPTEDSSSVERRVRNVDRRTLTADDELSASYRVPADVPAGTYDVWGAFSVSWTDAENGRTFPQMSYPFQVVLTIHEE